VRNQLKINIPLSFWTKCHRSRISCSIFYRLRRPSFLGLYPWTIWK